MNKEQLLWDLAPIKWKYDSIVQEGQFSGTYQPVSKLIASHVLSAESANFEVSTGSHKLCSTVVTYSLYSLAIMSALHSSNYCDALSLSWCMFLPVS